MKSNAVILESELISQIQEIAGRKNTTVAELVNQAVREHIQQWEDEKFEAEANAYEQMHPQLVKQYFGEYVAVHQGQIIDHHKEFETLFLRVRAQHRDIPILIRRVTEKLVAER